MFQFFAVLYGIGVAICVLGYMYALAEYLIKKHRRNQLNANLNVKNKNKIYYPTNNNENLDEEKKFEKTGIIESTECSVEVQYVIEPLTNC